MNRRSFMTGAAAALASPLLAAVPGEAAISQWTRIGSKTVSWFIDQDTIQVGRWRGSFRKIQLRVRGTGVNFLDLKVRFHNGGVQDVRVRSFIPAGGSTRIIDLNGGARFIDQVRMTYRKPAVFLPAIVEVWGRR
jgi:hypothetical protein